jgi:predicted chitinase
VRRLRRRLVVAFYRWWRARGTSAYWNAQDVMRIEDTGELVVVTRCETVSIGTNDFTHWTIERRTSGVSTTAEERA